MSIYDRYKKDQDGFRKLVELLETTPLKRREELIARGKQEDPEYTKAAESFLITFQDILKLGEMELTEVIATMKAKAVAYCVAKEEESVREKFLACVQKIRQIEVHSFRDMTPTAQDVGQAKKEAIVAARQLEAKGIIQLKKIPRNFSVAEHSKETKSSSGSGGKAKGEELFSDGLFGGPEADFVGKKKAG